MTGLAAALAYARRGWWVLPVRPYVSPADPGYKESKVCLGGLGIRHATLDEGAIEGWWARWPEARPAIHLKRSGLLVLDWDRYKRNVLAEVLAGLPITLTSVSPQGGQHLFFTVPDGFVPPAGRPGELDVKWDGYVILPAPGSGYSWAVWRAPAPWPADTTVAKTLGSAIAAGGGTAPSALGAAVEPAQLRLPEDLVEEQPEPGRRSEQAYRFVARAVDAGHADTEVLWLAQRHAPTAEKYGGRLELEVGRMLAKVRAEQLTRPAVVTYIPGSAW